MWARSFSRMYSRSENNNFFWFFKLLRSSLWVVNSFWKHSLWILWLSLPFFSYLILRWYCHHFHLSSFYWIINDLSMKIQVFIRTSFHKFLLYLINLILWLLVAPGIWKGKIRCLRRCIAKHMSEFKDKLVVLVEKEVSFIKDAPPLFLSVGYNFKYWF